MERLKELNKSVRLALVALAAAAGCAGSIPADRAEASPPFPEGGPILPYHDPGVEYSGRVDILPLPKPTPKEPSGGGGRNDHRKPGDCGTVFMCHDPS